MTNKIMSNTSVSLTHGLTISQLMNIILRRKEIKGVLKLYGFKHMSKFFKTAKQIPFDHTSKIVIMSDVHRGDGSWADTFIKNKNSYYAALMYYNQKDFTYIELGDGDELWENKKISKIINIHSDVFQLLSKYYEKGNLYFIFGNHDRIKENKTFIEKEYSEYVDERLKEKICLFKGLEVHEGLILRYEPTGDTIYLIHGHQVDFINDRLWRLAGFLVRNLWRPLELLGVNDPTSTAKNYKKKERVERSLSQWAQQEYKMVISGHTHRPIFPDVGTTPYFNAGSCVHPYSITAIEIEEGFITLVKWSVRTRENRSLYVSKETLAGPEKLTNFFKGIETLKVNNLKFMSCK